MNTLDKLQLAADHIALQMDSMVANDKVWLNAEDLMFVLSGASTEGLIALNSGELSDDDMSITAGQVLMTEFLFRVTKSIIDLSTVGMQ